MINVNFKGFVNEVKQFDWGTVYNVAHNQMRKTPEGKWEKIGADYFSVIGPVGFEEGNQVEITGRLKTKRFDKRDGSKGISLEVRAEDMTLIHAGTQREDKVGHAAVNAIWDVKPLPDADQPIDQLPPF